jgi:hypothetical protein
MIPKMPVPDLIRDGNRFLDKIMRKSKKVSSGTYGIIDMMAADITGRSAASAMATLNPLARQP